MRKLTPSITARGTILFPGTPTIFWMAVCERCDMTLPFGDSIERAHWTQGHGSAPEHVLSDISWAIEVRPDEMPETLDEHLADGWQMLGAIVDDGPEQKK